MKKAQLATLTADLPVLQIQQQDYVNAVVVDETGQALIFESPRPSGSGVYWHVLHHKLPCDSDPFTAVQTALLHKTGHQTSHWAYLGSHVMSIDQPSGNGFFFCAQQARQTTTPQPNGHTPTVAKWVPLTDLRYALLDGRIAIVSHALTVSLALLTLRR
ncbi:MAG: hypothetical protein WAS33_24280 [Candidatus Promineifilaceae bacterium]|nr:hypothetical protein [Anaerolineaceae bacterium]